MYSRVRRYSGARKRYLVPYKRYNKPTYKRRRTTTAIAPYARLPYFPRYFSDMPSIKYAKLNYVCHIKTNGPPVNNIRVYEYRINGMFDPEVALGGHQPMGFDEMMKQYEKYTVLKTHAEVENMSIVYTRDIFMCMIREQQPGDVAAQYSSSGLDALFERPGVSETLFIVTGKQIGRAHV